MITRLTVLYDADCVLCRTARSWLANRPQLVPLDFLPAGSDAARRRFPQLDAEETLQDITVVADDGGVYAGDSAWLICLWALDGYRSLAVRLARPERRHIARKVATSAGVFRKSLQRRTAREAEDPEPEVEDWRELFDRGWDEGWEAGRESYRQDCGGTCR